MKNVNIKVMALGIVGTVLILLTLGAIIRAVRTGDGLDSATASAAFALLGAMVAGAFANEVQKNGKNEVEPPKEDDDYNYEDPL